ncbi:MAG: cadherin repeat domain-containing protein [Porticoccaceae bacterium]
MNIFKLIAMCFVLTACGGGGGDASVPSSPQQTNQAPILSINAQIDVLEGTTAVATVTATDHENQPLTFSLSPTADRELFDISVSGVISFLSAPDYENPTDSNGDNNYELTVAVSDSGSASDSKDIVVTVIDAIEGRVIDAPLSGSDIYIISAGQSAANAGQPVGTSDAEGYFYIPAPQSNDLLKIMTRGGTDIETGVAMPGMTLVSDLPNDSEDSIAVTPISTVLAAAESAADKQAILVALNITGTVDEFLTTDIWLEAKAGNREAQSLQSKNQQIGLLISTTQSLLKDGSIDDLAEIAEKVTQEIADKVSANETIDLQSDNMISEVLTQVLSGASVDVAMVDAVSSNIADINLLLAGEDIDPTSAAAADFIEKAQTELQDAVKDLVSGVKTVNDFATETTMAALFSTNSLFIAHTETAEKNGDNSTTAVDGVSNEDDFDNDNGDIAENEDEFQSQSNDPVGVWGAGTWGQSQWLAPSNDIIWNETVWTE